jgi:cell division protein FtsX
MILFALVVVMTIAMKLQNVIYMSVRNVKSKRRLWQEHFFTGVKSAYSNGLGYLFS